MKHDVVIIDYGMGNVGSINNMLRHIGFNASVSGDLDEIMKAPRLILSGVGAFDSAMNNISRMGLLDALNTAVLSNRIPILGICLGMQLFTQNSEEGRQPGLGWIEARTVRFNFEKPFHHLKVPHMGWNTLKKNRPHPLFDGMDEEMRFYFVHSYHLFCSRHSDQLATTHYGYDFPSIVEHDNIYGVQFHPEKSHKFGMKLLENFMNL
jgi:glutamine amidotransferase